MAFLRSPVPDPSYMKQGHFPIQFCHPGYPKENTLFTLWATDESAPGSSGLYARFALDACAIVAANRYNGWLSIYQDINKARQNQVDANSILHHRKYYYHLEVLPEEKAGEPYKVVPDFGEWEFPHDEMPPHWQALAVDRAAPNSAHSRSNLSDALKSQDKYCRMSRCREKLQAAHIVPQAEGKWFERNNMSIYNSNQTIVGMDDIANAILLRADLHLAFDELKFTFVPKGEGSGAKLVTHLVDTSEELVHLYHNRPLPPSSVSIEMLYARLAWTIFQLLGSFLQGQVDRRLALTVSTSEANSRGFVPASGCIKLANYTTNRARSKKRNKPATPDVLDEASAINAVTSGAKHSARNRKRKFTTTLDDEPASNLHLSQGTELSLISETRPSTSAELSPLLYAQKQYELLRHYWLNVERQRSNKTGFFQKEQEFVQEVWDGRAISGDEVDRFYEACGMEVRDSIEDTEDI